MYVSAGWFEIGVQLISLKLGTGLNADHLAGVKFGEKNRTQSTLLRRDLALLPRVMTDPTPHGSADVIWIGAALYLFCETYELRQHHNRRKFELAKVLKRDYNINDD